MYLIISLKLLYQLKLILNFNIIIVIKIINNINLIGIIIKKFHLIDITIFLINLVKYKNKIIIPLIMIKNIMNENHWLFI